MRIFNTLSIGIYLSIRAVKLHSEAITAKNSRTLSEVEVTTPNKQPDVEQMPFWTSK